mmetsp:Transcript_44268/g.87356  ORF Transcript_44268/g.87356 Transcript_44268/m.87356 type:complete len:407 (-) Transcript_44268:485-1705(-)
MSSSSSPVVPFLCGTASGVALCAGAFLLYKQHESGNLAALFRKKEAEAFSPAAEVASGGLSPISSPTAKAQSPGGEDFAAAASTHAATDVPENAPDACPGVQSETAGKADACAGCPNQKLCASGEAKKADPAVAEIEAKLAGVKNKILVLSGKGGVGKSTVSAQLAWKLAEMGHEVGLLDIDICGPSLPKMMGVNGQEVHRSAEGWSPVFANERLAVMSIGFLLPGEDDAIIWRGPKKNGLIRQFLTDVAWGELDYLIVDTPPGTSDEHLSIVTYLKGAKIDGAVVVTTPQEVALQDVRKEINFCKKVGIDVLGVIENMSGGVFVASTGGAKGMADKMGVPFAGGIPLESNVVLAGESGKSLADLNRSSEASAAVEGIVKKVVASLEERRKLGLVPPVSDFEIPAA